MARRSNVAVADTRRNVLDTAVRRASVDGLEGLTIKHLADDVGMSKSGLFGLFGDKERLQLAALQRGIRLFLREVWQPVSDVPAGRQRLLALCERWLDFHERGVLPGGCFMTTAIVEFDARPGAVHASVAESAQAWLAMLADEVQTAVARGELPPDTDPAGTAFTLNALASSASTHYHLLGDPTMLERAGREMRRVLAAA